MEYEKNRTYLEVNLSTLQENYRQIRHLLSPHTDLMAVVKADAYGLGAVAVTKALLACGCNQFATATLEEAMELRDAGVTSPLFVLGPVYEFQVPLAVKHNIMLSVSSLAMAKAYQKAASAVSQPLLVQIAADVGMSRFGLPLETAMAQSVEEACQIFSLPNVQVRGLYTHMTVMSHPTEREFDLHQLHLFETFTQDVYARGMFAPRHCACSGMTLLYPQSHFDLVRISALLFGVQDPLYQSIQTQEVASLRSRIVFLKDVPRGATVGYGPHVTRRATRLAVIPAGFGDGLHRRLSHQAPVLLHGKRTKIFGKLCMDFSMIDVTDIPEASVGDTVTLFGKDGDAQISIFEYAALYDGTACEVITSLGKRINRIYFP